MKPCVSFKSSEKYLYDYAMKKRSFSVYVKDLIEADYKKYLESENVDTKPKKRRKSAPILDF